MTDPKDFESLDDLFRKTFEKLPETPDKSGWDTPSERVWQHVQSQIKPPRSGWSAQTITLLAAFAVTLTVGLYLLLATPEKQESPASETPEVAGTTEMPVTEKESAPEATATPATTDKTPIIPAKTSKEKREKYARSPEKEGKEIRSETLSAENESTKPSGKRTVSPNTTERRKAELARRAEAAWKTPLEPLPLRQPEIKNKSRQ